MILAYTDDMEQWPVIHCVDSVFHEHLRPTFPILLIQGVGGRNGVDEDRCWCGLSYGPW